MIAVVESAPKEYLEVKVGVPRGLVDAVCDFIISRMATGLVLEEEDDSPVTKIVFYVPAGETKHHTELREYLVGLAGDTLPQVPDITEKRIEAADWFKEYKRSIKPVWIGDDIVIRPTWSASPGARYEIVIEPRMTFGTGSHATTRSCLTLMRRSFGRGTAFLDMGAGSGVLSILADRLGASRVKAVDNDPAAVENCGENFVLSHICAPYKVVLGSIDECVSDEPYGFICANIIKDTVLSTLDELSALTLPGGILVLSGLLEQDEAEMSNALREVGQTDFAILRDEQWLTYSVRKR